MTTKSQEVMTAELAGKIQEYERQLRQWQSEKATQRRGALYFIVLAIPLWAVSYFASAETGVVNQPTWFTAAAFFAFLGALVLSIAAVVSGGFATIQGRPVKNFVTEKTVSRE